MINYWKQLLGLMVVCLCLLGVPDAKAQVTPQFNTPVQVSIERVYLSWAAFPGAQSYQIYWSNSPGVDLTATMIPIGSASTLGYNHVGLTGGATYHYRIRAFDQFGNWTLLSTEVSVTVPVTPTDWYRGGNGDGHSRAFLCSSTLNGTPFVPTFDNVYVYRSAAHNRIAWLQFSGATGYLLEVSSTSGGPWSTLSNTTNLFFDHTGLTGNTPYFYRITPAISTGCVVNPSTEIAATAIPNNNSHPGGVADGHARSLFCLATLNGTATPPRTPGFLVYEGITQLSVFWTQVPGAASYNIEFSTTSAAGPWTPLVSNHASTNYVHTGLVAGQTYYYRLRANPTSACSFDWSNTFSGVPRPLIEASGVSVGGGVGDGHAALKTCPTYLDGTPNSPNSQAISVYMSTEYNYIAWPQQNGATNYTVQVATNAGGPWSLLTTTATLATSHTPPSMVPGTQYFYRVTANLNTGCPLNPSTAVASFSTPTYSNTNCAGGVADGHASLRTCLTYLDGLLNSPRSEPITVYSSTQQNLIVWPQQAGAVDYTLEFANTAAGPWNLMTTTTALTFTHQPASLIPGTTYFYRVRANLNAGCPLNPSLTVSGTGVPEYSLYNGGVADGNANAATCPVQLNGDPYSAKTPAPTAYPSQDYVYVSWLQVPGVSSYSLELSTNGGTNWSTLSNTAGLFYQHATSGGVEYQYRLKATLSNGCPLSASDAAITTPAPAYSFYPGGVGDGHATERSCSFVILDQTTIRALGPTTFCSGDSVKLAASQSVLYNWFKDGVPIPGGDDQELVVKESGVYSVELFNIYFCATKSLEITVTVNPTPSDPTGLSNQLRCGNGTVTFSVNNPGAAFEVQWSTDGINNDAGTGLTLNESLTAGSTITRYARIRNTSTNCFSNWSAGYTGTAIDIIADFIPSSQNVTTNQDVAFQNISTGGSASYVWDFGDGSYSNDISPVHRYATDGVYTVTLTVTSKEGCKSSVIKTITVNTKTTATDNIITGALNIWGYDNKVYIDFSKLHNTSADIEIYNIIGQLIHQEKFRHSRIYSREIPNMETAYIIVKVENDGVVTTKKVFISNSYK